MSKKYGGQYTFYKCLYCEGLHVAKLTEAYNTALTSQNNTINVDPIIAPQVIDAKDYANLVNVTQVKSKLDIDKIHALDIPDITPVYGSIRGRTMSSVHQNFAWPTISEAGVQTIIDLQEDGIYSRLGNLCQQYGMRYLYYLVDNRCNHIDQMVQGFPDLCKCIDEGNFYIACAKGLHQTYIALCTYWAFHGADNDLPAPEICGYRKSQGHNTDKIMRVLNAFYSVLTQQSGTAPVPIEVFKERKAIIQRQSQL